MKKLVATTVLILGLFIAVQAQDDCCPPPPPTGVPFDGGLSILAAAAAGYAGKKFLKIQKEQGGQL